jgi:hypothetical protein
MAPTLLWHATFKVAYGRNGTDSSSSEVSIIFSKDSAVKICDGEE